MAFYNNKSSKNVPVVAVTYICTVGIRGKQTCPDNKINSSIINSIEQEMMTEGRITVCRAAF